MEIRNSIILNDAVSPVLNKVMTSLRYTLELMRSTAGESSLFAKTEAEILSAQTALDKFNNTLRQTRSINDSPVTIRDMQRGESPSPLGLFNSALPWTEAWSMFNVMREGFQMLQGVTNLGDSFLSIRARIDIMNDGLLTTEEIQDRLFASAMRSRAAYLDTANAVARLGILAGGAFTSNGSMDIDSLIRFSELVNKLFVIGGSTPNEQRAAMLQLTQAMAAGKLQGDEMRTIQESAPLLRNYIREYMGVNETQFRDLQKEGQITAEVIKNAVLTNSQEIDSLFAQTPITAAQSMTLLENIVTVSMEGILTGISSLVAGTVQTFVENFETLLPLIILIGTFSTIMIGRNLVAALASAIPYVYSLATGFAMANMPILIATGLVFALLQILRWFPEVMGYIVGGVYAFGTAFRNVIAGIADYFIFLINNVIITGINKILDALGKTKLTKFEYYAMDDVGLKFDEGYKKGTEYMLDLNKNIDGLLSNTKTAFKSLYLPREEGSSLVLPKDIDNVNNIKGGKISLDEDSIKWLNDEAAVQFVNRYTTLRPILQVQFGDVHETADVDGIVEHVIDLVNEAYATELEGD